MDGLPETRYAWSDDLSIAYQTVGEGDPYLVMVPGTISHVEAAHEISGYTHFLNRISEFCSAVPFDKRGYGLSDRVNSVPLLEDRLGDVTAVADAVGASTFMLYGWSEGGPIAALYAATYPDRVDRLVIFDAFHKFTQSPDSPHGVTPETLSWMIGPMVQQWGTGVSTRLFRPGDVDKREVVEEMARRPGRSSLSRSSCFAIAS